MANKKILSVFLAFNFLFLCCGVLLLVVPLLVRNSLSQPQSLAWVAQITLLLTTPLSAYIAAAVLVFTTVLLALPISAVSSTSRTGRYLLSAHGYLALIAGFVTLVIGLDIWFSTLRVKTGLAPVWAAQTSAVQSLLQEKFQCCGYSNSALFVKDATCPTVVRAADLGPCVGELATFANHFLGIVFTSLFGIAGIDGLLIVSGLCLMKERSEEVRYRKLDRKLDY